MKSSGIDERQPHSRWEIEARLLIPGPLRFIAKKTNVPVEVIALYEKAFFSVRHGDHVVGRDWVVSNVFDGQWGRIDPSIAAGWKYVALSGGGVPVDLLIAEYHGRPKPMIPDRPLFVRKVQLLVRQYFLPYDNAEAARQLHADVAKLVPHLFKADPRLHLHYEAIELAAGRQSQNPNPSNEEIQKSFDRLVATMSASTVKEKKPCEKKKRSARASSGKNPRWTSSATQM